MASISAHSFSADAESAACPSTRPCGNDIEFIKRFINDLSKCCGIPHLFDLITIIDAQDDSDFTQPGVILN